MELLENVQVTLSKYRMHYSVIQCDPQLADTAAFCDHYGFKLEQSANTIIISSRKVEPTKYAVCVVLGTDRIDVNKKVCKLLEVRKASFADAEITKKLTGMMIGGVTAIGIEDLPIYVDAKVMDLKQIIIGGGNRSTKLLLNPIELKKLPNLEVTEDLAKRT